MSGVCGWLLGRSIDALMLNVNVNPERTLKKQNPPRLLAPAAAVRYVVRTSAPHGRSCSSQASRLRLSRPPRCRGAPARPRLPAGVRVRAGSGPGSSQLQLSALASLPYQALPLLLAPCSSFAVLALLTFKGLLHTLLLLLTFIAVCIEHNVRTYLPPSHSIVIRALKSKSPKPRINNPAPAACCNKQQLDY